MKKLLYTAAFILVLIILAGCFLKTTTKTTKTQASAGPAVQEQSETALPAENSFPIEEKVTLEAQPAEPIQPKQTTQIQTPLSANPEQPSPMAVADQLSVQMETLEETVTVPQPPAPVVFESLEQIGGIPGIADTTSLMLIFSIDPTSLSAEEITLNGAVRGALHGTGTSRILEICDITAGNGETITVDISNPNNFLLTGSPRQAVVYKDTRVPVTLESVVQIGGTSRKTDSNGLMLTFSADPISLTADNISLTGAEKGTLSGTGTTRMLEISHITAGDGKKVSIELTDPSGYVLMNAQKTAVVYRVQYIGMPYQGGVIAYIFQSSDTGYVAGETHGLIASIGDISTAIQWNNELSSSTGAIGTELGTGKTNTAAIISTQGSGSYAAKLCDDYVNTDTGTGVYSDWYLPSKDELNLLYLNKAKIGGFTSGTYWTSTEETDVNAWLQYSSNGMQSNGSKGYDFGKVRAVRNF